MPNIVGLYRITNWLLARFYCLFIFPDSENPPASTSLPQITITGPSDTTDSVPQVAVTKAAVTTAAQTGQEDSIETTDDNAPLIQPKPVLEFRFLFAHLTCLGLGVVHMGWMAFGSFLTIPMYFR